MRPGRRASTGSGLAGSAQIRSAQIGSVQIGSTRAGSTRIESNRIGSKWMGSVRIGAVLLAASAFVLSVAGCGRTAEQGAASASEASIGASLPFLQKIPDAPSKVAYSGERHVLLSFVVAGTPKTLEYDETVHSDGRGRFAIVPGRVASPEMSLDEAAFFAILQERRDGFFYRYRDFRIRDWNGFLRNWSATDRGLRESVAGRDCAVLEFRRRTSSASGNPEVGGAEPSGSYRAWIDTENGLVMRAEEFDAGGTRVGLVEFRELTLSPDLSKVDLHGDRSGPEPLDLSSNDAANLGFALLRPKILPAGYRLERAESVSAEVQSDHSQQSGQSGQTGQTGQTGSVAPSERWARLAYGDGVDEIFFLQGLASEPAARASASPAEADVGPRFVRVFHVGPWTVLQGQFDRTRAIVMGKVDEASLLRMLKSAVH